jgi:hypothetical protein
MMSLELGVLVVLVALVADAERSRLLHVSETVHQVYAVARGADAIPVREEV